MSAIREADFYYGAVLSLLLNNGICPALIEGGVDRQVYQFTTDNKDFILFLKYRSKGRSYTESEGSSWGFVLSANDISELRQYLGQPKHLSLGLVCGSENLSDSEYAVMHKENIEKILAAGKTSFTISRKKGEGLFRCSIEGGRKDAMRFKSNQRY